MVIEAEQEKETIARCDLCGYDIEEDRPGSGKAEGAINFEDQDEESHDICEDCLKKIIAEAKVSIKVEPKIVEKIVKMPVEKIVYKVVDKNGNEIGSESGYGSSASNAGWKTKFD